MRWVFYSAFAAVVIHGYYIGAGYWGGLPDTAWIVRSLVVSAIVGGLVGGLGKLLVWSLQPQKETAPPSRSEEEHRSQDQPP